ncbi:P-type conjugative transfer protein TrbL [Zobellella taiwanensis]|uniref:P-type conjugative transfer protein TrbL n=1 Tax=Zobellella taiwanensis TaxID=347535 RepID=UPI001FEB9907|nr:P-type conjugative transfer protein TrbL [Zobellella taiwanensis]
MKTKTRTILSGGVLLLHSSLASANLTNQGILDQVVTDYATRAASWQHVIIDAASWLFWTLVVISMVWTFGMMALRKADIGEFFAELVRFIIFTGFFWWLLVNGPAFANSIIQSLARIGEQAAGVSSVTPSGIVDVGFMIWKQAINNLSAWSPVDSLVGAVLSAAIMLLLALVAINMLLMLIAAWLLAYAGIFFLGFGGSRWTSDMAINYYKTVLGVAVQIMTMVLLVGIGNDMLSTFYARMNQNVLNFEELGVMLVFCMALLLLVKPGAANGRRDHHRFRHRVCRRHRQLRGRSSGRCFYGGGWNGSGRSKHGRFCGHGWCCKPGGRRFSHQGSVRQGTSLDVERERHAQYGRNIEQ